MIDKKIERLIDHGRYKEARDILGKLPNSPYKFKLLMKIAANEYNFDEVYKCIEQYIKDPKFQFIALYDLANYNTQMGNYNTAIKIYESLIYNKTCDDGVIIALARLYLLKKDPVTAREIVNYPFHATKIRRNQHAYMKMQVYSALGNETKTKFDNYLYYLLNDKDDELLISHIKEHAKIRHNQSAFKADLDYKEFLREIRAKINKMNPIRHLTSDRYSIRLDHPIGVYGEEDIYDVMVYTMIGSKKIITAFPVHLSEKYDKEGYSKAEVSKHQKQETKVSNENTKTVNEIISLLKNHQNDQAQKEILSYLKSINKEEYKIIIDKLIEVDIISRDYLFHQTRNYLFAIEEKDFSFSILDWIQAYYGFLCAGKIPQAEIYLSMIESTMKLNEESILSLKRALSTEYQDIENKVKSSYIDLIHNNQALILWDFPIKENEIIIKRIIEESYPELDYFLLKDGYKTKLILTKKEQSRDGISIETLENSAQNAFLKKEFNKAIELYGMLLSFDQKNINAYSKIGLAYYAKKDYDNAINYLKVASMLSKNEKYYFKDIISIIKKEKKNSSRKKQLTIDVSEEELREFTTYLLEHDFSIKEACQNLNIPPSKADTIVLTYAKRYFMQGNEENGKRFLKAYEQSSEKTKFNDDLYKDIVKNAKFYHKRSDNNGEKLSTRIRLK